MGIPWVLVKLFAPFRNLPGDPRATTMNSPPHKKPAAKPLLQNADPQLSMEVKNDEAPRMPLRAKRHLQRTTPHPKIDYQVETFVIKGIPTHQKNCTVLSALKRLNKMKGILTAKRIRRSRTFIIRSRGPPGQQI